MAHIDIFETQKSLSRDARRSARQQRRQAVWAVAILMLGGGYALWHANAAPQEAPHPIAVHAVAHATDATRR